MNHQGHKDHKGYDDHKRTAHASWFVGVPLCVFVAVLIWGARVGAHEIGTTRVSVVFEEGRRYHIEIVTDATSLMDKIQVLAGSRGPELQTLDRSTGDLHARLAAADDTFRQRVAVSFDGSTAHPRIEYSVSRPADLTSPPLATVRLAGDIPAGARHFTWTYSWTFASYALTMTQTGSTSATTEWLEGGQVSAPYPLATPPPQVGRMATAWRYLTLGFTHIVPKGMDHMLFVLGIFLLSSRLRSVLWQVSAFTVAHSITLGLSIYGLIAVRPAVVEPLIAISIAYVAIENLFLRELKSWRIALVFAFGLLHGMGFAGALKELGLPRSEFLTALVTFNLGVEGGQLAVIGVAFLLVGWQCSSRVWYRRVIVVPASALIACTAVYWTVARLTF